MNNNYLNLMNLLKRILISTEIVCYLKNKKVFNKVIEERSLNFRIKKTRINPNNLIYKYKTDGRSSKDFSVYQNPINLIKDLRDGNINPKEVLKNKINVKSD